MKRLRLHGGVAAGFVAVGILAAAAAGFGAAWFIKDLAPDSEYSEDQREAQFPLLSVGLFEEVQNDTIINFVPLRKKLTERFSHISARKSFYFEYLPDGTSIRLGADDNIIAASLLKVPMVMNLYRAAELGKISLDDKAALTQSELDDNYGELWRKGAGYQMTYREAAQHILKESNNTATRFVYDHIKDLLKPDEQSLARLDVDQNAENGQAVVNARSYSSVIKGLYLGACLNKTDSQEILHYLTESDETERLTKLLPNDVQVAHKNGVYNANSWAQSDCGLVYAPKRPYLLCVMVELPDDQADALISQVSKDVYDFVTTQ